NLQGADETLRCDSDDRERAAVNKYLRAEHARIEIMLLPVTVTGDRDRGVVAGRFFFRHKCAASRHRNTEHREMVRADDAGECAAGIAFLADTDQREIETHYVGEDGVLLADVDISGIAKTAKLFRVLLVLRKELHQFVRL